MPKVQPSRLTRDQIAAAVGNNPRVIRLFEQLLQQVGDGLPEVIADLASQVQTIQLAPEKPEPLAFFDPAAETVPHARLQAFEAELARLNAAVEALQIGTAP